MKFLPCNAKKCACDSNMCSDHLLKLGCCRNSTGCAKPTIAIPTTSASPIPTTTATTTTESSATTAKFTIDNARSTNRQPTGPCAGSTRKHRTSNQIRNKHSSRESTNRMKIICHDVDENKIK